MSAFGVLALMGPAYQAPGLSGAPGLSWGVRAGIFRGGGRSLDFQGGYEPGVSWVAILGLLRVSGAGTFRGGGSQHFPRW